MSKWLWLGSLVVVSLLGGVPAAAAGQDDPYGADPLGIVANYQYTVGYGAGVDVWQVVVCRVPNGGVAVSAAQVAQVLEEQIGPYFAWLSEGRYRPTFQAGSTVVSSTPSGWPDDPFQRQFECELRAAQAANGETAGALIVVDVPYAGGYGTAGYPCVEGVACPTSYPDNGRMVVVGAGAVSPVGLSGTPLLSTVAHEIGHALWWPHSFGGLTTSEDGMIWEYDNPMDIMSGVDQTTPQVGTIALNRYAVGWVDPTRVVFHRSGTFRYQLGISESPLLVLPRDEAGVYETLGARVRTGYDAGVPKEGVEVYRIDQRSVACPAPTWGACWGPDRRTAQVPAAATSGSVVHVLGVGEALEVRGVRIAVVERTPDGFVVEVSGASVANRFIDDDGNPHEANIAAIAERGITLGCNPPTLTRYCPGRPVTRAEMAAFVVRALGSEPVTATAPFPDVPSSAWYAPYVARLAELGIVSGYPDGTFRPGALVSRAEMAVLLSRAFPGLAASGATGVFTDVPIDAWFAPAVEALYRGGVTNGCRADPPAYCPYRAVPRDEMASFLARIP